MDDPWFLYLFLTLFNASFTNNLIFERSSSDMAIREKFEEIISKKLDDTDICADEIKRLAEAYSELSKNDHLREMAQMLSFSGFGSAPTAQIMKAPEADNA